MLQILNNMAGTVGLVFTEADKEYSMLPLKKDNLIEKNLFEFEVLNPYYYGRKRIIELSLDYIYLKKICHALLNLPIMHLMKVMCRYLSSY